MGRIDNNIKKIFQKLGVAVTVTKTNNTLLFGTALIQPLLYKNKIYIELMPSEVGRLDDGCHLYLGPADLSFSADDYVSTDSATYVVQRVEKVYFMSKHIYTWAVLRPTVERRANV